MNFKEKEEFVSKPKRNYKLMIIIVTAVIVGTVSILMGLPGVEDFDAFDVTILPMMNAIFNGFAFIFLIIALISILRGNEKVHKRFIYAAFVATSLFLVNYLFFHYIAASTSFGGEGFIVFVYYFVLITHILLAVVTVPLALISITRAWNEYHELHKKVSRWTMPIWLYVSFTGIVVYLMIRPYY